MSPPDDGILYEGAAWPAPITMRITDDNANVIVTFRGSKTRLVEFAVPETWGDTYSGKGFRYTLLNKKVACTIQFTYDRHASPPIYKCYYDDHDSNGRYIQQVLLFRMPMANPDRPLFGPGIMLR